MREFSLIIFLLILLKVEFCQQNLNASSTIITRKLMHKNGLKEFTVQKNIKGNECACSCYCSLPNSQDAMAQMRLTSPNVDLAKFASPNSTRRFEIEKIISGNQCKCSCVCAEPDNTIYDENDSQIGSKKYLKEEIGIMKNDNKNDVNLVEEKKSNLEEFVETSTSNSTKEIEPNLSTNSFEKISSKLAAENNEKWTTDSTDEASYNSLARNKQNPTTFTIENDSRISSDLIEQNQTTNTFDSILSSSTKENEPILPVTSLTKIGTPSMTSTLFISSEKSLTSSAAESEEIFSSTVKYVTSPNSVDSNKPTLTSIQFGRSPSSPTPENWHNNYSEWHKIESNESEEEKKDEKGIRDSTENIGATKMSEEAKGGGTNNDAVTTVGIFRNVENSEKYERTFTTTFLTTPSSSSPEIVQIVPDDQKTTQNVPNQEKSLEEENDHSESSSKFETTPIGWIPSSSISFNEPTTLSQQNQNSIEKKIITSNENTNEQSGKLNGIKDEKMAINEERKKEENIENTKESLMTSTAKNMNKTTMSEEEADEEKSTFDPQFKAKVAQLLNKLKVKLFRLREMEQEKNIWRNGTENVKEQNAEKDEKKENGEEKQIFFQTDQKVEQTNGRNQTKTEKNGTSLRNEVIGPTELPENKNTGQNEKNIPLDVSEGGTSQIFTDLIPTTLTPQFSAFVTSDGTEDEENEEKTTSIPNGVNEIGNSFNGTTNNGANKSSGEKDEATVIIEGKNASSQRINEEPNSTTNIKESKNSPMDTFISSTPYSLYYQASTTSFPYQPEEETTLNPVFKARVANLLNRLKEQLYRLRAAQQQNSTLNGTNSEGKHSIEANPLANLLNSSSNPVTASNGKILSKSEQMLEGLQRKLELLKMGEKQMEKVENTTYDGMAKLVVSDKSSGKMTTEDISLNKATTISSSTEVTTNLKTTNSSRSVTEEPINMETTISSSSAIETSTNIIHKMNGNNLTESTVKIDANETLSNSNNSSEVMSTKYSTEAIQIGPKTSTIVTPNVKNATTNNSINLQVKTDNLPSNPNDAISVTTPAIPTRPSVTTALRKESNMSVATGKITEETTESILNASNLAGITSKKNITTQILLEPIIGQSKNLVESSTLNITTENSKEDEEEEDNFAFVTEETEMPKMNLPSSNGGNSSELDEERPIVFVLNETAAINNGRDEIGNYAKNEAIGFDNSSKIKEESPKNESNTEGHLFPFTNDFLIDLPPKMLEKGKQQEMDKGDKKWEDKNIEEEGKQTRVILLPASPRGRIHNKTKSRPAVENASKPDEIQQMNGNSSPDTVEQNWPSLITIKEKEERNVGKMSINGKSKDQMIEAKELDNNDTKIPNKVESINEDNRMENLPRNSPKLPLKFPKSMPKTTTTIRTTETMENTKSSSNFDEKDSKNGNEQQNWTVTQKTTKKPRRKFVAPQAQSLIERLEQARKLREEQVKLEMMEAIRQEQIGSTEPDPQLAERRREIEQRLLQLAQAERLHREMLEEETAEAQKRQNVGEIQDKGENENIDNHSTIQPQTITPLLDCSPIRRFLHLFHISNPHEWIEQNCKFARRHFPNASCPQIGALLNQCFQESQQKEEEAEE